MEASQRKLSAAVVVLLLVMAAETGRVQAGKCSSPSATYKGVCLNWELCHDTCLNESSANNGGDCGGLIPKCLCTRPCARTLLPAASTAQLGGAGALA